MMAFYFGSYLLQMPHLEYLLKIVALHECCAYFVPYFLGWNRYFDFDFVLEIVPYLQPFLSFLHALCLDCLVLWIVIAAGKSTFFLVDVVVGWPYEKVPNPQNSCSKHFSAHLRNS